MSEWYNEFFDEFYLKSYKDITNQERTLKEVEFIERVFEQKRGSRVLDLCCGDGRHSIELAKRNYSVVALDLNQDFLKLAKEKASKEGLEIQFICKDMRDIPFEEEFDIVINLFTSFGYLETPAEDSKAIKQVAKSLKVGGQFLIDFRNRDWIIAHFRDKDWREVDGLLVLEKRSFEPLSGIVKTQVVYLKRDGSRRFTEHSARLYTFTEINEMLKTAGLAVRGVYGDFGFEDAASFILSKSPFSAWYLDRVLKYAAAASRNNSAAEWQWCNPHWSGMAPHHGLCRSVTCLSSACCSFSSCLCTTDEATSADKASSGCALPETDKPATEVIPNAMASRRFISSAITVSPRFHFVAFHSRARSCRN